MQIYSNRGNIPRYLPIELQYGKINHSIRVKVLSGEDGVLMKMERTESEQESKRFQRFTKGEGESSAWVFFFCGVSVFLIFLIEIDRWHCFIGSSQTGRTYGYFPGRTQVFPPN